MIKNAFIFAVAAAAITFTRCSSKHADPKLADDATTPSSQQVKLAAPFQTKSTRNYCKVIGWPVGIAVMPDGSLLVADDSGNKI